MTKRNTGRTKTSTESVPLDCLAIGAHPDDCELFCGGTLALALRRGKRCGILDLTRGERGTRGSAKIRAGELAAASRILGLTVRESLDLGDCALESDELRRLKLVAAIRRLRPRLIVTHWPDERHPDHRRAHELVRDAMFLANVGGYGMDEAGSASRKGAGPLEKQRWLVDAIAFGLGYPRQPDPRAEWVVDVTETFETKMQALRSYATQFLAPEGPKADPAALTYLASRAFWERVEQRSRTWGHLIGATHGEPFILDRPAHAAHPLVRLVS